MKALKAQFFDVVTNLEQRYLILSEQLIKTRQPLCELDYELHRQDRDFSYVPKPNVALVFAIHRLILKDHERVNYRARNGLRF